MPSYKLDMLYLDSRLVAINKPSGLLVHPSALATDRVTCLSLLRHQLNRWLYPLHRLDRGTSGVLLFALDPDTARTLSDSFARHTARKVYLAVVRGFAPDEGVIDYPLSDEEYPGRSPADAITSFSCLATVEFPLPVGRYPTARYSLVRAEPITGKRHQIRRHMAHIRHPIIGDTVHGEGRHNRFFRETFGLYRLLLHAEWITLPYPDGSGRKLAIQAPTPPEFAPLLQRFNYLSQQDKQGLADT